MIKVHGDMSMLEMRQALFEALTEIEDELAVRFTRNMMLVIHPTNELGEKVVPHNKLGAMVGSITKKGGYKSAASEYKL